MNKYKLRYDKAKKLYKKIKEESAKASENKDVLVLESMVAGNLYLGYGEAGENNTSIDIAQWTGYDFVATIMTTEDEEPLFDFHYFRYPDVIKDDFFVPMLDLTKKIHGKIKD